MLSFIKKIFGLPTDAEVKAAQEAPYKLEMPVVNQKSGDVVDTVVAKVDPVAVALDLEGVKLGAVNDQITDSVTQVAPAKKTRKPRAKTTEKVVKEKTPKVKKEKAAKAKKPAAIKATSRSKKA
jgi:hypothetical protein